MGISNYSNAKGGISMSIYKSKTNYRKIYEQYYGSIPKDETGRTYDIHHKDGNHENCSIDNLIAVSIQEHYNIHYNNQDWKACSAIMIRISKTPKEISDMAKLSAVQRTIDGTNAFVGNRNPSVRKMQDGTHHFIGETNPMKIASKNGTHHFIGGEIQRKSVRKQLENGTHPFLNGAMSTKNNLARVAAGTHPSQIKKTCEHCRVTCGSPNYARYHGDRCKLKIG